MTDPFQPPPADSYRHKTPTCHAKDENGCNGRPHRCYLYVGHYGPHKAKPCMHTFHLMSWAEGTLMVCGCDATEDHDADGTTILIEVDQPLF